ncbi:hypothetical protein AJ79_00218 [Helicocarpus griseus UAMH5409]|uniref:Myb-like domain-containing protein n=1 Tax=Helicocarpus griseus UAMH5409 TaxID=1447875 RepID=A0A2B7YC07_9EURO|nr:hypothetical protein AJ79_00218 [Helicocarpus griseus UAMH5409]
MVNWDATADRALLLNTIDPGAKPNWERVATTMGDGFSAEACRQRFGKLKRETLGPAAPGTGATTPTPKRKANGANKENGGDGPNTPTKKPRARKPKVKDEPKAKEEPKDVKPKFEASDDEDHDAKLQELVKQEADMA